MRSNRSWALSTTSTWQCGPPPNPASFRPVEFSPWPGWFGSAEAADANPKDVSTTTATTTNARFIVYPSLQRTCPVLPAARTRGFISADGSDECALVTPQIGGRAVQGRTEHPHKRRQVGCLNLGKPARRAP